MGRNGRAETGIGAKGSGSSIGVGGRTGSAAPHASGLAAGTGPEEECGVFAAPNVRVPMTPLGEGAASKGAPPFGDSSEVGTGTADWQNGHFTFLPDDSSRARNRFPHDGQPSVIGMVNSSIRRRIEWLGRSGTARRNCFTNWACRSAAFAAKQFRGGSSNWK